MSQWVKINEFDNTDWTPNQLVTVILSQLRESTNLPRFCSFHLSWIKWNL
jgi:hypothetical protein